ncbi:IS982 family transposase [Flavobacterium davisii]|uniref:IS982 family transposase n=1 Tax=Flavobacterium davisii TaxID=2906077 RepID=A0A246GHD7_9FLAO|nr:IS982 family transposase [Flavobacterium davisii]OWP83561.1 IS982 family transposase [Flavobacterium davisii]
MSNIEANYKFILNELLKIGIQSNFYFKAIKPKRTDLELIVINVTAEYSFIDSEYQLFRVLANTSLKDKIERSVYNKRKRRLFCHIEVIRNKLVTFLNQDEQYFIVDSMPLEICKNARANRSKICKKVDYAHPNKGFCASQNSAYYGYKLHAVCSISGVFQSFDLSQASVHDIHYLKDIKQQMFDCEILGDRGYLSAEIELDLFNSVNIKLETPMRINQKDYKPQPYIFRKSRKRIETLFSQLCDQFKIRNNYTKTFEGFKTRILSKLTALTMIQYLNKFVFQRNINNIKVNLI